MKNYYDEEKNFAQRIIWHLKFLQENYFKKVKHDEPKDFDRLVHEVAQIDLRAALYLRKEAPLLLGSFVEHYNLEEIFFWRDSKQGAEFWDMIAVRLEWLRNYFGD